MNDRNRRSAAEVMANAARVVKAAVNIVRAAIAGGLHGAAAAAAKELLPTIIKFAVGVLIAIIVIPMFVISAMPNMFFGYETSEKNPQITMREQALSIGGAYLSLEDFEKTQQDTIITGEAAAYENQGVTIDEIRVSSKFNEEDLCWYIAINSVAHKQDLSEMKPEEVQSLLISNLKHTTRLESSGDQTVLRIIFQPLDKDKLMDDLGFDEDAKTWAGALFETAGQFAYIYALADEAHVALSAPIISAYCAASVLWSRIFLKEKLSWKHYTMICLVVIGIAIMGFFDL